MNPEKQESEPIRSNVDFLGWLTESPSGKFVIGSPAGKRLICVATDKEDVVWEASQDSTLRYPTFQWSADESRIVVWTTNALQIRDAKTGKLVCEIPANSDTNCFAVVGDEIVVCQTGIIRRYRMSDGQEIRIRRRTLADPARGSEWKRCLTPQIVDSGTKLIAASPRGGLECYACLLYTSPSPRD